MCDVSAACSHAGGCVDGNAASFRWAFTIAEGVIGPSLFDFDHMHHMARAVCTVACNSRTGAASTVCGDCDLGTA